MFSPLLRKAMLLLSLPLLLFALPVPAQDGGDGAAPLLTVKQLMDALIVPTTATIWGAYQLQSEGEWQEVENAALAVIAAGDLMRAGGAGEGEAAMAAEADWQRYNGEMIGAARQVLEAVAARDEEALFAAGNDALYPPCESCHQQYQAR